MAVVEVYRRLEGLPLAVELAARRLRTLPVTQVDERLAAVCTSSRRRPATPTRSAATAALALHRRMDLHGPALRAALQLTMAETSSGQSHDAHVTAAVVDRDSAAGELWNRGYGSSMVAIRLLSCDGSHSDRRGWTDDVLRWDG